MSKQLSDWPQEWPNPKAFKKGELTPIPLNSSQMAFAIALVVIGLSLMMRYITRPTQLPTPLQQPMGKPVQLSPLSQGVTCTVDVLNQWHDCAFGLPIAIDWIAPRQAAVQLSLDPAKTVYRHARFDITYGARPTGWSVNIGDSATNGGYTGDNGTQSHDAELQILGGALTLYGSDHTPPEQTLDGHRRLLTVDDFAAVGETVSLEIGNERVIWQNQRGEGGVLEEPYLFALARQPDREGTPNYDIYAAFNRTIAGYNRVGSGVTAVTITLFPDE